jgi:hypothetical protein
LRKYFSKPSGCGWWLLAIGILAVLIGLIDTDRVALWILGGLIVGGLGLAWALSATKAGMPTDDQVDTWLREDIANIVPNALTKCGLESADLVGEPLVITGPVYWSVTGIDKIDLLYKKGKDGYARFSVYDVTIIFLTDQRLTSYRCDFNLLKNVWLNEATTEYFYQDVVSVSTREVSTSYTLPNGQKLVSAQTFSVQVPSGDAISVVVSAAKLQEMTAAQLRSSGADKAVEVIRAMLRTKKGTVRVQRE